MNGEQRHRADEAARAGQHDASGTKPRDGVADEHDERRGQQVERR